jgi:type I restriction enzyme R subunit
MITEDQREQLGIQWFQDTGWSCVHGAVISPEGVAAEREDFRAVVLKACLAEALRTLIPAFSQREKEKERGGIRRLTPAIPEEPSTTHKDSLSV